MGGDFVRNFATPELDFASVHIWADLWLYCDEECKLRFLDSWVIGHLEEARNTFNKPVLLEEFGKWKPLAVRDRCASSSISFFIFSLLIFIFHWLVRVSMQAPLRFK